MAGFRPRRTWLLTHILGTTLLWRTRWSFFGERYGWYRPKPVGFCTIPDGPFLFFVYMCLREIYIFFLVGEYSRSWRGLDADCLLRASLDLLIPGSLYSNEKKGDVFFLRFRE